MTTDHSLTHHNQLEQGNTIKISVLILLVLASAFFPRVLTMVGVPSAVNFLHFAFICVLTLVVIPQLRGRVAKALFLGMFFLLVCIIISALSNGAGAINVVLDFLLLGEPFMLLLAITGIRMNAKSVKQLQFWLLGFASIHVLFANVQYFALGLRDDDVKGVFFKMGAGHHVGGSIAGAAALFIFFASGIRPRWLCFVLPPIFLFEIIQCDAKQVFLEYLIALLILAMTKVQNVGKFIIYAVGAIVAIYTTFSVAFILFPSLIQVLAPERVSLSLDAKFSVFQAMQPFYDSPLDWFFGLGPGHTISRLGWLAHDYSNVLEPLGMTITPIFPTVFAAQEANYFSNSGTGSSLYSLLFSWAGIWGDLGLLGLGSYLYLWSVIWRQCQDELSKFFLIATFVSGVIFTWMEEPAYMLYVSSLVGLQWQRHQQTRKSYLQRRLQFRRMLSSSVPINE